MYTPDPTYGVFAVSAKAKYVYTATSLLSTCVSLHPHRYVTTTQIDN